MARALPAFTPDVSPAVPTLAHLGKLVRNRRAQAQLRIDDAAALSGVSSDVLSRLENGKPVTVDKLMLVFEGLGLRMLAVPKAALPAVEALLGQAAASNESQ